MKTESMILRQSLQNRIVHWGVAFSTFILIASGIFQMPVSKRYMINELPLMAWSGDYHISLMLHYVGAFGLIFFVVFHLYFHIARAEFDIFPKKGDGVKSLKIIKAMLFGGVEPKSEKYLPEQRLAYFFIGLVLLLLIITGLIKTLKNLAGWNISDSLYLWSAQLHNLGMFLIILGIIGHLMAFVFKANRPLLRAMFSGKVDSHYIVERHSLWQEGVKMARDKVAENNIDSISCHTKPLGEVSKDLESTRDISPFS